MDEALVLSLTGKRFARESAVLPDFERLASPLGYPYAVRRSGAHIGGVLLLRVDDASLRRLDEYEDEGRLYRREDVVVVVGPRSRRSQTYVGVPEEHRRP